MFEDIGSLMPSPKELVIALVIASFIFIIKSLFNLMYGKSKNAVFTFIKKRSAKQIASRRRRVELMRRGEKDFHLYLSLVNSQFLIGIFFTVWACMCLILGLVLPISVGLLNPWFWIAMGLLLLILTFNYFLEGIAIQQDLADAVDDDQSPL